MANALYPKFKESLLNKEHDLNSDLINAALLDGADETYDAADNTYVSGALGITAAAKVANVLLTAPTIALGVFDTADFVWAAATGDQSEVIILWNDTTTTPVADALILWMDTGITGMPITPNGGNINGTVNAAGWFSL